MGLFPPDGRLGQGVRWTSMCTVCFCSCISLSRATPLGRSHHQASEPPTASNFPTELPTNMAGGRGLPHRARHRAPRPRVSRASLPPPNNGFCLSKTKPCKPPGRCRRWGGRGARGGNATDRLHCRWRFGCFDPPRGFRASWRIRGGLGGASGAGEPLPTPLNSNPQILIPNPETRNPRF